MAFGTNYLYSVITSHLLLSINKKLDGTLRKLGLLFHFREELLLKDVYIIHVGTNFEYLWVIIKIKK